MSRSRGTVAGVGAGLVWGLAFVLPSLAPGWSAEAVSAGRYLVYGAVSLALVPLLSRGPGSVWALATRHWRAAAVFAVTGNVGYYLLLVVALQHVGAPVSAAVIGSGPVVVAVAGNLRDQTYAWRRLSGPLALVVAGLLVVNLPVVVDPGDRPLGDAVVGLLAAVAAVAVWASYALANATFLDRNPSVPDLGWAAAVGLWTGVLALALLPVVLVTGPRTDGDAASGSDLVALAAVSLLLGVLVSWGATALWNAASRWLPTALAGLLVVVETVSGFGYAYLLDLEWPPVREVAGLALVVAGAGVLARVRARTAETPAPRSRPAGIASGP